VALQQILHPDHARNADEETKAIVMQNRVAIQFAVDLDAGVFQPTASEYVTLPAVLLDVVRIVREIRAEIIRESNGSSDE
jgi:hypothetical protein